VELFLRPEVYILSSVRRLSLELAADHSRPLQKESSHCAMYSEKHFTRMPFLSSRRTLLAQDGRSHDEGVQVVKTYEACSAIRRGG